jgi:hypothetical protein
VIASAAVRVGSEAAGKSFSLSRNRTPVCRSYSLSSSCLAPRSTNASCSVKQIELAGQDRPRFPVHISTYRFFPHLKCWAVRAECCALAAVVRQIAIHSCQRSCRYGKAITANGWPGNWFQLHQKAAFLDLWFALGTCVSRTNGVTLYEVWEWSPNVRMSACVRCRGLLKSLVLICRRFEITRCFNRGTRWRSWLRHCATSRKVEGSIPDGVTGIFPWPRRLRWAGHVARMGDRGGAYRALVRKSEGRRPIGRPRRRKEDHINMDLREVEWGGGGGLDQSGAG